MNPHFQDITVDRVATFQIYEDFKQRFPCSHRCKIRLIDDRKCEGVLTGDEIYILIQGVAKEKISFKRNKKHLSGGPLQEISHFDHYEECPYSICHVDAVKTPTPNELLLSIFLRCFL